MTSYVKCQSCHAPTLCADNGGCLTAAHWAACRPALIQGASQAQAQAPTTKTPEVKKTVDKPRTTVHSPAHTRPTRKRTVTTTETVQQRIAADLDFALESGDEFLCYRGQVAATKVIRYVAALNADVSRADFVEALVALGYNRSTVGIQFAESRRESLSCGDCKMLPDGRLQDV